jgi:hypothetical protein
MKLTELDPKWVSNDVFTFLCPHCRTTHLLCKRIAIGFKEQVKLVNNYLNREPEDDHDWPIDFVPMKASACWKIDGAFINMTVTPSIDASASGHWHGFITSGEIR